MSPEAEPLQAAVALIRTKLMSFQQRMERRQAELEMLHELRQFSSKVGARCPGAVQAGSRTRSTVHCFADHLPERGLQAVLGEGEARRGPRGAARGSAAPGELVPEAVGGVLHGEAAGDAGAAAPDAEQQRDGGLDGSVAQIPGDAAEPGGDAGRAVGGVGSHRSGPWGRAGFGAALSRQLLRPCRGHGAARCRPLTSKLPTAALQLPPDMRQWNPAAHRQEPIPAPQPALLRVPLPTACPPLRSAPSTRLSTSSRRCSAVLPGLQP